MIRAALIGTGGISGVHLTYLSSRDDVEIAALCDLKAENLDRRHKEFGGRAFSDLKEMLDSVELDAVWLCTPPRVRMEPLVACAAKGVPVFCEKPAELDEAAGEAIASELAERDARTLERFTLFRAANVFV